MRSRNQPGSSGEPDREELTKLACLLQKTVQERGGKGTQRRMLLKTLLSLLVPHRLVGFVRQQPIGVMCATRIFQANLLQKRKAGRTRQTELAMRIISFGVHALHFVIGVRGSCGTTTQRSKRRRSTKRGRESRATLVELQQTVHPFVSNMT